MLESVVKCWIVLVVGLLFSFRSCILNILQFLYISAITDTLSITNCAKCFQELGMSLLSSPADLEGCGFWDLKTWFPEVCHWRHTIFFKSHT